MTVDLADDNTFYLSIGMYANGKMPDVSNNTTLEADRKKLNFTVSVQLINHDDT